MAITVPQHVPVHPLTVDDYHRMIEAGVFGEDDRVELLEGVLVEMRPISPEHARVVARLTVHFAAAMVVGTAIARVQSPLTRREDRSEPEPDLLVVATEPVVGHPETALLAVEVAVTSHAVTSARCSPRPPPGKRPRRRRGDPLRSGCPTAGTSARARARSAARPSASP